jgi:hypothetical protein
MTAHNRIDLTGQVFGRLTVLGYPFPQTPNNAER